ncbi:hypothetical protein Emag_006264 [Eimeria magna]
MSRTVAAAPWVLTSLPQGQSSLTVLADAMRQEQLGGPCGDGGPGGVFGRVLVVQRGAAGRCHEPGQSISARVPQRGIPYGAGPAGIDGGDLRTSTPGLPRRRRRTSRARLRGPPGRTGLLRRRHPDVPTPPPPLPASLTEELGLPEPSVAVRDPPQQLGMDGLLNGSGGRSPADDVSSAANDKGKGSAAEHSGVEQPAPKRERTPGG